LIPPEGRHEILVKEVPRVQGAIAQKFKYGPVQRVGPRFRDDADLSAGALPVFGGIGIRQEVELADRVDAQQILADTAGRVRKLAAAAQFDSVQQE